MQNYVTITDCVGCGQTHTVQTPWWDEAKGTVGRYRCPNSEAYYNYKIEPEVKSTVDTLTDTTCTTCGKAKYRIDHQSEPLGGTVTQWLICSNEGCGARFQRRVDFNTGRIISS